MKKSLSLFVLSFRPRAVSSVSSYSTQSGIRVISAAGLAVSIAVAAAAQPVAPTPANSAPANEPAIVLSPFVVGATSDVGYEATESLAGTGLATKLTDLGASVSVVTSKFLEDTGSKDLRDALVYQANIEVTGFGGNLSGASPSLGGVTGEPSFTNSTSTRVRGLAAATQARNFFRNVIPMDGYNTERIEINRGANSLLFGVGSPAGIINTATTKADLRRNFRELGLQHGSYDSRRISFDLNQVIRPGELAVRVSTMADHENFRQKPSYNDDQRIYGAAEWRLKALERGILSGTTIRASIEEGVIKSNNPRVLTPTDRISSWFASGLSPELQALGAQPKITYDPRQNVGGRFTAALGTVTLGVINNVNRSPTFTFQDNAAVAPRDAIQPTSGLPLLGRGFVSNRAYFEHSGLIGTAATAYVRETARILVDAGYPDAGFFTSQHFSDPSIFNFFNTLIDGENKEERTDFQAKDIVLDQVLFGGLAGFEVAYNTQIAEESRQSLIPSGQPWISIDVNPFMWTGEVNPNFGRPFISTGGSATYNESEVETTRAKAFYRFDFQERMRGRLGSILGRHVLSSLAQRERFTTDSRGGGTTHYTPDVWTNGSNQSRRAAQSKQIVTWHYIGDSVFALESPAGLNLPGIGVNRLNFQDEVNGKGLVLAREIPPSDAIALQNLPQYRATPMPLTVLREDRKVSNTAGSATKSRRTLDSQAIALQSNWLDDHLVSTFGWRKERSSTLRVNAPSDPFGEDYVLVNDPSFTLENPGLSAQVFDETLFSWSAVAKAPRSWLTKQRLLSALNFYYGVSENFDPPASQTVDPFGRSLTPPGGETKEYGVYADLFNGKVAVRLNFFETTQTGSFNDAVGGLAGVIVGLHQQVYNSVRQGNVANRGDGFPANYVAPPQELLDLFNVRINNGVISSSNPGVRDVSDFRTEGMELEVLLRPTAGLSLIMNVARQESVRTNTGAATRRLLFETPTASGRPIAEEWRLPWAGFVPLNTGGVPQATAGDMFDQNTLAGSTQRGILNRWNVNALADGGPVHELREWRANVVANYEFRNERLRGFAVGSALRWQDKASIGAPVETFGPDLLPATNPNDPANIRVQDVRNPIFGPSETRVDAWVSYKTRLWNDKVDLKLQLNVRNILTGDELIPAVANPDGTIAVWSIAEPRRYTLSATFGF